MPHGVMRSYLFADLREYTVFVETQGDAAAARLLRAFRALVRAEVGERRGAEIKTEGDSFYVVFRTPGDAVRCAMGIVRRAEAHNKRHPDLLLRIGIGVNSGEAVELGGGYVGSAVILAARLAQQAEGGRVLVTDTVRSLLRTGAVAPMRDLGPWKLKGVTQSVHVYEVETQAASIPRSLGPTLRVPPVLLPPPIRGATGLVVCPELVQRDDALAALGEHLAAAARGEGRVVALTGEAGVGKSRVVREVARRAAQESFYVFGGRAHASAARPYEPFVAALRPYVEARGTDILRRLLGTLASELRTLLPEFEISPADDERVADEERRERFFRAVHLLLEDAVALRPVLLVLEDLHETDAATRDLLAFLAATLHGGFCIVFTYREEEVGATHPLRRVIADLDRERRLAWLTLPPLDIAGVGRMSRALLGERVTDALTQAVFERSEGVPFYVEELLKTAIDDPETRPDRLALPRTVRDSVQMRVARLAESRGHTVADLLEVVAIAGVPVGYEFLITLSGRPEHEAADDIAACLDAQLLERPPTQQEMYQFRHTLTRDAIDSAIPLSRRRRLHQRVADALEALDPSDERGAALSLHFAAAGDLNKAVRYARAGARAAIAVGAYSSAIDLLTAAAEHARVAGDEREVLDELGAALHAAGRAGEAETAILRVRELSADPQAIARLDVRLAAVLRMQGRRAEAIDSVRRAIAALEGTGGEALAEARVTYADLVWAENDVPRAAELAAQALESARAEGTDRIVVRSLTVLGSALSRGGDAEGMSRLREAIALGQARGLGNELVDAYVELERAERAVGDWEAAIATAEAGLKLARERGHEFAQARLLSQLAFNYVSRGRYGDARTAAEQAVALARPGTVAATTAMTSLALVLTRQGEPSAALGVLDRIAPEMQRADPDQIANYLGERASALLGVGRLDDAQRTVNEGLELHRTRTGSGLTTFLVALDVAEARRDDAELERLIALFARQFAGRDTPTVRVLQQEMESVLLHLRTEDAASAFERVAGEYAALGVPMRAAYRRAWSAIALRDQGGATALARRRLQSARAELRTIGAQRYAALVDAAVATRRPAARRPAPGLLDAAELRIALLIARGYTDARIARTLRLTPTRTTSVVNEVRRKLGATTRGQIASWVVQRGIERPKAAARA
ncbi:MAG TPA: AAA family ATPase [Candidatus Limnocylindria bacterium]